MNIPVKLAMSLANNTAAEQKVAQIETVESERPSHSVTIRESDEIVVPYKSNLWLGKKLFSFKKWENAIKFLMAFLFLASSAIFGFTVTFFFAAIVSIILILLNFWYAEKPSLLVLNDKGITFKWNRGWGESAPILWADMDKAVVSRRGTKEEAIFMEIYLFPARYNTTLLPLLFPGFFVNDSIFKFRLPLSNIETAEARQSLKQGLTKYLPPGKIDRELVDLLNPIKPSSYTTLWLDSLSSSPKRSSSELLQAGNLIANGRYEIIEQMAAGGQGTIYSATALEGESAQPRPVVLKEFVLPSHAGYDVSVKSLENVNKEAELLKRLDHPGIVNLHESFVEDHRAYLVLEYVEGPSLKKLVEQNGPLPSEQVIEIGKQISQILMYLHELTPPVIHRDLTPDNLILQSDGKVKLIDFNVAQQLESTTTRTIVGKHCYIPPEQFRGKATPQSDVYSAGATLYFLLTAIEPEPITTSHPKQQLPDVDDRLNEIIAHATTLDTSQRCKSAQELFQSLARLEVPCDEG